MKSLNKLAELRTKSALSKRIPAGQQNQALKVIGLMGGQNQDDSW